MTSVTVTKRGADRIRAGHLWIYRSDVINAAVNAGSIVAVRDQSGNFVGQAFYSDRSEIALRFLTRSDEEINREWWAQRIHQAARRRQNIAQDANAYRLFYSEADLIPSLIIDRYADLLVIQTLAQGTEAVKPLLLDVLLEQFSPKTILERNDVRVRTLEGLPLSSAVLYGPEVQEVEVKQHGVLFFAAPMAGQKTGSFLDQRENQFAAESVGYGRTLDCFTFAGGFALHLSRVCDSVVGIDVSADAIDLARRNAALNNLSNVEFLEANVFDALRTFEERHEKFDTIVLDPPAFAKNRGSVKAAVRGYKEINLRALKLLNTGGILISCTCSYHVSEAMFLDIITDAAKDARRRLQLVAKRTQASDHPILLAVPETHYLKCMIARVIE